MVARGDAFVFYVRICVLENEGCKNYPGGLKNEKQKNKSRDG
jgi:hypothetical protein